MATTIPFQASSGGDGGVIPDPKKTATGSEARDLLTLGMVYTGKVLAATKTNTYTVAIDSPQCQLGGVQLASAIVSGMLGYQDSRVLAVDTPVGIAYGNPSFIFSAFPSSLPDETNGNNRSVTWGDPVSETNESGRFSTTNVAEDMVAGEFDIDNLFGVGIRFLTSLIAMKAGDRAKVECHLLNDMVRIVSSQFRHIHGLGDDLIFDHGRPTLERNYTSYRHELMGKVKESEPLFKLKGDEVDKKESFDNDDVSNGRVNLLARSRYLEYMGFVGDFIHRFVCDPPTTLVSMTDRQSGQRAGKCWEHIGSDGSYILQSTSEIRLERVTRIPVPHRIKSHEDPEVTKARKYRELDSEFLKTWDYGNFDKKDAYRTAYQLRQYSRWLSRFQAFARAMQLDDEYDMPNEKAGEPPDWNNGEEDRKAAGANLEYFEAYSCYTILRDGSQVLHDGYGSSVVLSNGNVQLSASRHLDLEAAGDVRVACNNFFVKARRHVEISASAGGMILHCYAFMRQLCEKGSIHIRSDADDPTLPPEPKGQVEPPIDPIVLDSAILLESSKWKFAVRSEKQVSITVDGSAVDQSREEDTADIVLTTKGSFRVKVKKFLIFGATKDLILTARHYATKALRWYGDINEVRWDKFVLRPKSGWLQAQRMEGKLLNVKDSIRGPKRGPVPPPDTKRPVGQHTNHIMVLPEDSIKWMAEEEMDEEASASLSWTPNAKKPTSPWEKGADEALWGFMTRDDYYWDDREDSQGALVQTLTQQYIKLDHPEFWGGGDDQYDTWTWSGDTLRIGKRVSDNRLGFGGEAKQFVSGKGRNLHESDGTSGKTLGDEADNREWKSEDVQFRILKY